MLRTDTAVTIYRQDYTAPAFRIDDVALEIDLVPERTRIVSRLRMTRLRAGARPCAPRCVRHARAQDRTHPHPA